VPFPCRNVAVLLFFEWTLVDKINTDGVGPPEGRSGG
jgi:hypothetical protein